MDWYNDHPCKAGLAINRFPRNTRRQLTGTDQLIQPIPVTRVSFGEMRVGRFDINQHNTTHRDGSTDPAWTSPSTNLNSRSSQEICCILCQKMFWKLLNQQSWWNSPVKASCSKSEKWFSPPSRLGFRLNLHFSPKILILLIFFHQSSCAFARALVEKNWRD